MIVAADTSTWVILAKYYLPLDRSGCLYEFLDDKNLIKNTSDILPPSPKRFSNQLDHNFSIPILKKQLNESEYTIQKEEFLRSADCRLILYALNFLHDNDLFRDNFYIMTEESKTSNDNKLFKKIPLICDFLNIKILNATDYLKYHDIEINISAKGE